MVLLALRAKEIVAKVDGLIPPLLGFKDRANFLAVTLGVVFVWLVGVVGEVEGVVGV